jgi:hypothetical protein
MAVRTGLEPATLGVTGRYSNQTELPHQLYFRTLFFCLFIGDAKIGFLLFCATPVLKYVYLMLRKTAASNDCMVIP